MQNGPVAGQPGRSSGIVAEEEIVAGHSSPVDKRNIGLSDPPRQEYFLRQPGIFSYQVEASDSHQESAEPHRMTVHPQDETPEPMLGSSDGPMSEGRRPAEAAAGIDRGFGLLGIRGNLGA